MARMSAGRALIESLRAEDVEYVFAIVGSCMVEFMDELPRNPTGKILKRELE